MKQISTKTSFAKRILDAVLSKPGMTDRELTNRLFDAKTHPSRVNQECRLMASMGLLNRHHRPDGHFGNYPFSTASDDVSSLLIAPARDQISPSGLSEDEVKKHLAHWLESAGWAVEIAWGKARGPDLIAKRGGELWIIEAKGSGSLQPMRVNYFLAILGQTLQRMSDTKAKYSIALPDMTQFHGLWQRLPKLAKQRTGITALFVSSLGQVDERS